MNKKRKYLAEKLTIQILKLSFKFLMVLLIMNELTNAQDWAELNHFKEDNSKLASPLPNESRVVFMGNSITQGWSDFCPEFFDNKPYVERGISGQTTSQMLLRFRQDVIHLNPKLVVILAGTNDIAGNTGPVTLEMIMDNLISMCELSKANNIKVILCSVLPASDYLWSPGKNPNREIPRLNNMIREYSKINDILYLDYFAKMVNEQNGLRDEYTYDGVHPNKKGYEVMGPLAEAAILQVLNK